MFTAIIILNYNNSEDTIKCIESVEKYNSADVKYIVVDNGSTRQSVVSEISEYIKNNFSDSVILNEGDPIPQCLPHVSFYVSSVNDGYAKGNNKGLSIVYSDDTIDNVLILNNDILFVADIIPVLNKQLVSLPNCGIVSPVLYRRNLQDYDYNCARMSPSICEMILNNFFLEMDFFHILSKMKSKRLLLKNLNCKDECPQRIDLPSGSCMLVSKDVIKKMKGFDENTFLYYEENILYEKLKAENLYSYIDLKTKCIHLGASTTKKETKSIMYKYSLDSMSYYFRTYKKATIIQSCLFGVSMIMQRMKLIFLEVREKFRK